MKLRYLLILPILLLLLIGCVKESSTQGELSEMGNVPTDTAGKNLNPIDIDTVAPAPIPNPVKKDTIKPKPKLDTAITVLNYCDSLLDGAIGYDGKRPIDVIIIHSSYYVGADTFSVQGVIKQYNNYHVGAHYLIDREGTIYRLAKENSIAFHAGDSQLPADPDRSSVNKSSIGIEIICTEKNPPTEEEYKALIKLVNNIRARHKITYIYRHSDIAPNRKTDPWSFDWEEFLKKLKFTNPAPVIKEEDKTDGTSGDVEQVNSESEFVE